MSTNIFNRDDGNKLLSYAQIDNDFDSYWENEARNPVRNRIRIGKQYQATIQPLLKPNELDKDNLEERETLKWTPENELNEQQLEQYLQFVKIVSIFSRVIKSDHHLLNSPNDLKLEINETGNETKTDKERTEASHINDLNDHQLNEETLIRFKLIFKCLSQFLSAHHPNQADNECSLIKKLNYPNDSINKLNESELTETECILFAAALQACGKNFSSIRKEFASCKSISKALIDYYNLCLNQNDLNDTQTDNEDSEKKKFDELRNKLNARLVDGKVIELNKCSSDLNNILFNLIKTDHAFKELNPKDQESIDDKDKDDSLRMNYSLSSLLNSSMNSSVNKNSDLRPINKNSAKNEDKATNRDQNKDKKVNKNIFRSNEKRLSLRSTNKIQQQLNDHDQFKNPINLSTKTEVKDQYEFDEKEDAADYNPMCLGTLKFFKNGELILKLNAKKPEENSKCKWEESTDSIEMNKLRKNQKKKMIASTKSKLKESLEYGKTIKISNEDQDDSSSFDSSEDSRSSSNFSNLQKPITMSNLFKKSRVKVENNFYVPLSSASSANVKEENELKNRKPTSPFYNEDELKRKLKSPKTNASSKKKVLKLNQCTNQLNISSNLIQQLNQLSSINSPNQKNSLINQHNLLSSLPFDLREKLISLSSESANLNGFKELNNLKGLKNLSDLNTLNNLNNLSNLTNFNNLDNRFNAFNNLNDLKSQLQNQNNLASKLLASIDPQFLQATNNFLENIDSIKIQNQIQSLISNLNALIEADQNV